MRTDMSEGTSSRMSELSEELTKCNEKLQLAGSMGIGLLDEKRRLEEEIQTLRCQCSKLVEVAQKDKHELQQSMRVAKSERDCRIAELEDEVNELQQFLSDSEQRAEISNRQYLDNKQLLEDTIRQLTYSLEKVTEEKRRLHSQLSVLTQNLCEMEGIKEKLLLQQLLQAKMEELQRENLQQNKEIHELQSSSEGLARELKSSQVTVLQKEQQLQQKDELLMVAHQELTEMQETVKQLQHELNEQVLQTLDDDRSMSLYEELHIRKEPVQAQDCGMANDNMETVSYTCGNCVALMEKMTQCQKETEKLNKQVLELIEQKLSLAQQLEMWEGDVESLVGDQVTKQLKDDTKRTTRKEGAGIMQYLSRGIKKVAGTNMS